MAAFLSVWMMFHGKQLRILDGQILSWANRGYGCPIAHGGCMQLVYLALAYIAAFFKL
jgi:hypothetical protein